MDVLLRATRDLPQFRMKAGDLLYVRPGHPRAAVVQFDITPNPGAFLGSWEAGDLTLADEAIHPSHAAAALSAVGSGPLPPRPPGRPSLHLV